ncbi:MAG: ABC transporter permease [Rickettsiaceae bacterium]|nr:ABC transporter permease [Rickettsiaceae bacterium]
MEPINWYGAIILTKREVKRFLKVYNQTIISPMVSALLFLAIFVLAMNNKNQQISNIDFIHFISYGLIIMSITQQSFANSSSSFIMYKVLGYINDIIMPPLGYIEIIFAFIISSVIRGVLVGITVSLAFAPFIDYQIFHPFLLIIHVLLACILLAQLGLLGGLISNTFDQLSAVTNYLINPLAFLSGTFYSVKSLPLFLQHLNLFNPFFYIIDGFRYCFTNQSDGNIILGTAVLLISNLIMFYILCKLIKTGWRIKS